MKGKLTKNHAEALNILEFEVAGKKYGFDVLVVQEIIQPLPYTNLPHANRNILGLIQLNGEVLPVISMRRVLKLDEETAIDSTDEKVIIAVIDQQKVGFHVDHVSHIHRPTFNHIENALGENPYTIGKINLLDEEIEVLDCVKIINGLYTEL